ncbi:MAG: hypothetical protein GY839_03340, partial [candidate division Zixibacteria bacterium]|nr:hypothetical protein [candidate division Zixibacteria bacterium]
MIRLKYFLLITLFVAICGSAGAEVYSSYITVKDGFSDGLKFSVKPVDLEIISVEIENHLYPVELISPGYFSVYGVKDIKAGARIDFYFIEAENFPVESIILRLDGSPRDEEVFIDPGMLLDIMPLVNVTDSLVSGIAGVQDTHKVGFEISTNQIEGKGEIWFSFNADFDVSGIIADSAKYSDDDATNDGSEPTIDSVGIIGQTVIVKLDSGTPAVADSRLDITLGPVVNNNAGDYTVTVQTLDSTGAPVHTPTASAAFTIDPAALNSVTVSPAGDLTVPSDSIVVFSAIGQDTYGNEIGGLSFSWSITVDSCGDLIGGNFQAKKVGECYITAASGGFTDSSGLITVEPSALNQFGLTGYPASVTAGTAFPGQVVVTAFDVNDNIIIDFADSVYFYSDDDSATIVYDDGNLYTFQASDSGQASIAGTNFTLKLAGSKTMSVANSTDTTTSLGITVSPTLISSYGFSALGPQTAGLPFILILNNAVDQYGNDADGSAVIAVNHPPSGGNSPFGVPPALNSITIINGTGTASQTLTLAEPTVLKGIVNAIEILTDTITVNPGVVGSFGLTDYPQTITAGAAFSSLGNDPTVTVRDLYGNVSTNFSDSVYFGGAETMPATYKFVPASDNGVHTFSGDDFIFTTAGTRRFHVYNEDTSLADTSEIIEVNAAALDTFTLSEPGMVTAGVAFALSVNDAVDEFGNSVSATITIADSSGVADSPDGTSPVLNDIVLDNGSGSAQQILVKTGTVVLKGTSGSFIDATNNITVDPGALGSLNLSNYPDTIGAGQPFPSPANDPAVTVKDILGNVATTYTGTVTFSGPETVPGPDTFELGDAGEVTYSGSGFIFETAGLQSLIVTDGANSLADTSSPILVVDSTISSFTISAPANVTAGTPFSATISNAQDQYGNDASGVVAVTVLGDTLSPNGDQPLINNITISEGSGSANQMLVLTGTVRLIGTFGSFADTTAVITVGPGAFEGLVLSDTPDTLDVGQVFDTDPTVTIYDIFGNIATNYLGI